MYAILSRTICKNLSGLTFGWEGDSISSQWWDSDGMAAIKSGTGLSSITKYAVHGSRMAVYGGVTLAVSYSGRISAVSASVDGIVALAGINDTGNVTDQSVMAAKIGSITDTTNDTVYGAMYVWYNGMLAKLGSRKPIGFITPYYAKSQSGVDFQYIPAFIQMVAQAMVNWCCANNVPCLDLFTNSGIDENNYLTYCTDGVHLNTTGRAFVAPKINDFLNTLSAQRYGS